MFTWARNNLPNLLTCCNLACGVYAIALLMQEGESAYSSIGYLVIAAGIFDFFDGFVARLIKASSSIGKDLDSLADMVTFGTLPALVAFHFCQSLLKTENGNPTLASIAFLIAILSAVRLAIFNNDTRQTDHFVGVPTPANAFFIIFLVIGFSENLFGFTIGANQMLTVCVLCSMALVAPVPLIALKFKSFGLENNWSRYTLIISGFVFLLIFQRAAVPLIILLYIGISILINLFRKNEV